MAAAVLVGAFAVASPARAHEAGTHQVVLTVAPDGAFHLVVPVDPPITLQRLELAAGRPLTAEPTAEQVRRGVVALAEQVRSRVDLRFDGSPAPLAVAYAGDATEGALWLSGRAAAGARTLRFAQSLLAGRYALRVEAGGEPMVVWLDGDELGAPLAIAAPAAPGRLATAWEYLGLGFTHIVPLGVDHILFVLGIFLLSSRLVPLLQQVTAFTVAHSITLGLAMYGVVSLPPVVVEPLIALSIVYVALENVGGGELRPWRLAVVFGFGLLHGLGFAGVLAELGLPRERFVTALVGFNLGVELGQLAVLAAAFATVAWWSRGRSWYRARVVVPASLAIAAVGLLWTVQRIWGALG
jgi:hypothetical protein